jgi:ATP phosphoribosyltransferase regulatory subunit
MDTIRDEIRFIKQRNKILLTLEQLATTAGYIKVESDYLEDFLTYTNQNERQDPKRLVKVQDLRGNLFVLRPDTTTNIIKQVIPRMDPDLAAQFYYMEKVFSYNEDGDIEQTRQFGVELIGNNTETSDDELLQLLNRICTTFGLEITLELGNQKWLSLLLSKLSLDSNTLSSIRRAIIAKNSGEVKQLIGPEDSLYKTLLLDVLGTESKISQYITFIQDNNLDYDLLVGLEALQDLTTSYPSINVRYDLSLINPFDYYNGPIFKGYIKGCSKDIIRGGRYDYLTKEYGERTKAQGFSLDLDIFIQEVVNRG